MSCVFYLAKLADGQVIFYYGDNVNSDTHVHWRAANSTRSAVVETVTELEIRRWAQR